MKKDGRPGLVSKHRAYSGCYTGFADRDLILRARAVCVPQRPFEKTPVPSWSDKALSIDL